MSVFSAWQIFAWYRESFLHFPLKKKKKGGGGIIIIIKMKKRKRNTLYCCFLHGLFRGGTTKAENEKFKFTDWLDHEVCSKPT